MSFPNAESPWAIIRGGDAYIQKAFSERFGFDVLESRKFKLSVKNKATGAPLGVYYVMPIIYWWHHNIYISVGLSALLVSTDRAMRELLHRRPGTELAPRFLCAWVNLRLCYQVLGSTWSLIQQWKLNIIKGN